MKIRSNNSDSYVSKNKWMDVYTLALRHV